MNTESYSRVRKQSALVADYVETVEPSSPVKKIKQSLVHCRTAVDPRPILAFACTLLQRVSNDRGNTLLHEGLLACNKSLCRLSLKQGFINQRNNAGETPLHVAIRVDWAYGVRLLLQNGPDLLIQNNQGMTAIELAEELDRPAYVKLILENISSLDKVVSQDRLYRFLGSVWYRGYKECLSLIAKIFPVYRSHAQYVYQFDVDNVKNLLPWAVDPTQSADQVTITFHKKDRDCVLYHFLGKKALQFVKDRNHIRPGSFATSMYTVMLWTWRHFWHSTTLADKTILKNIDRAIVDATHIPSDATLASQIISGQRPIIIRTGWNGHSVTVVFSRNWLFICNRGEDYINQKYLLAAYRITRAAITPALIRKFKEIKRLDRAQASVFFTETLLQAVEARGDSFCDKIHAQCQPSPLTKPTCVAANMRVAIYASLLSNTTKVKGDWNFFEAANLYSHYRIAARFMMLHRYLLKD